MRVKSIINFKLWPQLTANGLSLGPEYVFYDFVEALDCPYLPQFHAHTPHNDKRQNMGLIDLGQ
jgi:hypothetical protein